MNEPSNPTLDEILSAPGNASVYKELLSALREGDAIAFVGAGASAGMYPLWNEFIDMLADYAVAEGKARPRDAARWKADTTSTPQQRVNVIVRKLGEPRYRKFLKDTFGPRKGPDGKRYTAAHAALLRMPFRGYVTTNYDPALDFARMELRPGGLTTGTPTWQDDDDVNRWYNGDIFKQPEDCPLLWLHGFWQRPDGIVLNGAEYFEAYKPSLYRRLFESLWGQRRLAFVGFGFNDPQFTFMVGGFLRDFDNANALPRHVAILGLPADADGAPPDDETVAERRDVLEADYHVRPLFYPARGGDHSALQLLLDAVAAECAVAPPNAPATPAPAGRAPAPDLRAKWFHEPSNDDKFLGRDDELARLDRWVRDEAVRAVGVSAVGGTGKTALVGHWLKETAGWRTRPFEGLFGWSFYQSRATSDFLRELLAWAHESLGEPKPGPKTDLVSAALELTRRRALVVVLDGLEVLQEGQEESRHGAFLDGALRELLTALCRREHRSLAVLTSRFVFADLQRFLGTAFHQLELHGLDPESGARLLRDLGVGGTWQERGRVSERLDGHPLGLRVFADALPGEDRDEPGRFLDHAFRPNQVPEGAPLNDKLRRLLVFYEKRLTPAQSRLLSVVALFRTPVADETVLRLARGLFGRKQEEPLPDAAALAAELSRLHLRGILSREPIEGGHGSACHPILRDHFRSLLLSGGADTARRAADLLKGQPSKGVPRSVREIEPILLAIELLLDASEFKAGNELYESRLMNGQVFKWIPAPAEGLQCELGFVRDESRQRLCKEELSPSWLGAHLNGAGLFAMHSGQLGLSLNYYGIAQALDRDRGSEATLRRVLINQSELFVFLGRLDELTGCAQEALRLAAGDRDELVMRYGYTNRGHASALTGEVRRAAEEFAIASRLEAGHGSEKKELHSIRGIRWAETLIRAGQPALAGRRTRANRSVCALNHWNDDVARCHRVLGWCALVEGRLDGKDGAEAELNKAEPVFRHGQLLFELAQLHLTAGGVALARADAERALDRAREALVLAAPRGMRLVHADALVLRGRARMSEGKHDFAGRALDDAEEALRIARECGYAWAERDGLFLKAEAHAAQANAHQAAGNETAASREREASRRARADAEALAAKLVLTDEDLAAAEAKAAAWMKGWGEKGAEVGGTDARD